MDVKNIRLKTGTIIRDKKLKRDYMLLPEDCDIRVDISEWYEMTKVFNTAMQVYVVSVYYQTLLDMETLKAEKKNLLLDRYELGSQMSEKEKDVFFTKMLLQGIKIDREYKFPLNVNYIDIRTMKVGEKAEFYDTYLINKQEDFFLSDDLKFADLQNIRLILTKKSSTLYLFQTVLQNTEMYLVNEREIDTTKKYTDSFEKLLVKVIKNNFLRCKILKSVKYSSFSYQLRGEKRAYKQLNEVIKNYGHYLDVVMGRKKWGNYNPVDSVKVDVLGLIKTDEKAIRKQVRELLIPRINNSVNDLYIEIKNTNYAYSAKITSEMEEYLFDGIYKEIIKRVGRPHPNRNIITYVKKSNMTPGIEVKEEAGIYYVRVLSYIVLFSTATCYTDYNKLIETMYHSINTAKTARETLLMNHFKEFKYLFKGVFE